MKKLLYIGWVNANNIGDDLMWDTFKNLCTKHKIYDQYDIEVKEYDDDLNSLATYDTVVLGGGSQLLPGYIEMIYKAKMLGKKVIVWGSGYDWAEKEIIEILEKEDTPAYLFSDETEIMLQDIVPQCEFFGVRGPLTYKILKNSFVDMSNLIMSGDPGFLLEENQLPDYSPITKLIGDEKIVAINWGTSFNRIYGNDEERIEDELVKVCEYLVDEGYKVYMYIMWDGDIKSCTSLYKKIKPSKNLIFDTNLYNGGQILNLLKRCEFSINLKLHGNITSATANIPFICLGYRFKCFDFAKSINCDNLIIPTDSQNIYSDVIKRVDYIKNNYDEIRNTMKTYIDDYKILLESPFTKGLF